MKKVEIFIIGPQKAATRWMYEAIREHPELYTPQRSDHGIHYFDMFSYKSIDWYHQYFIDSNRNRKLCDVTYSYIRSPWAARRIYQYNPKAKIILCMRNPVDRAFSHYWHEKKKGKYNFDFSEVLDNYDLFASWLEPGFYAEHIERFLQYFPEQQILYLLYDDLKKNPKQFLKQFLDFAEVNSNFEPSFLNIKINKAGNKKDFKTKIINKLKKIFQRILPNKLYKLIENIPFFKSEYDKGIPLELKKELYRIAEPEVIRLEKLLNINLNDWKIH